jgi:hypothetical protein
MLYRIRLDSPRVPFPDAGVLGAHFIMKAFLGYAHRSNCASEMPKT